MPRDSRSRSRGRDVGQESKIQSIVDERQQARRDRDFNTSDRLREELRDMGVHVDDTALTWRGPNGLDGKVSNGGGPGGGGGARRDGDWDCPSCGAMVFASKDTCFKCGTRKGSGRGRDRDRRRRRDDSRSDSRRRRRR